MKPTNYETSTAPFYKLLQQWRSERGLTRKKAAEALGVAPTTFDGWLYGRHCAQELSIRKLMQCLSSTSPAPVP